MILKDNTAAVVEGSLSGDVIDMEIAQEAHDLVMHHLAGLYNDQVLAVIREISTNGFDATIDATEEDTPERDAVINGTAAKAIEVTLPSRFAPIFSVRDYGTGMSASDLATIYSKFGASTKRHSNDFNGALGFGCKAPLAYTPQFTVTSVKDGLRTTVAMGRKPSGGGTLTFPEKDEPTTEPSGTTVIVPVKAEDVAEFNETARDFFLDWTPGTVLVNGEQPAHRETKFRLTPTLAVIEDDTDYVVMVNVRYPVARRLNHGLRYGYALLAHVDTGMVEFSPSREGLKTTADNQAVLDAITEDFLAAAKGAIQRKIDGASNRAEAMETMLYWREVMPRAAHAQDGKYTFRGETLPEAWKIDKVPGMDWPFLLAPVRSHTVSRHDPSTQIDAKKFGRDIFVTGFKPSKMTANHKRRLNMWRDTDAISSDGYRTGWKNTGNAEHYILCREGAIPADVKPWIDPARIVDWEYIRQNFKLPTATGGFSGSRKALMGSYDDVWTEARDENDQPTDGQDYKGEVMAADLRADKPLYYFQTNSYSGPKCVQLLGALHREWTAVKLQANRVAKFQRDFPQAKCIEDAAQAAYEAWRPTVTERHLMALAQRREHRYSGLGILPQLDPAKVDDPAIKEAIALSKIDLTVIAERSSLFQTVLPHSVFSGLPDRKYTDPMDAYPLFSYRSIADTKTLQHTYIYLNAAFAAKP